MPCAIPKYDANTVFAASDTPVHATPPTVTEGSSAAIAGASATNTAATPTPTANPRRRSPRTKAARSAAGASATTASRRALIACTASPGTVPIRNTDSSVPNSAYPPGPSPRESTRLNPYASTFPIPVPTATSSPADAIRPPPRGALSWRASPWRALSHRAPPSARSSPALSLALRSIDVPPCCGARVP